MNKVGVKMEEEKFEKDQREALERQRKLQEQDIGAKNLLENMHTKIDEEKGEKEENEQKAEEKINEYMKKHSETEKYEYLVRGATLVCRNGSHKRRINLPKCHGVYVGSHPLIHALDCIADEYCNISMFGVCDPKGGSILETDIVCYKKTEENSKDGTVGEVTGKKCEPFIIGVWQDTYTNTRIVDNGAKNPEDRAKVWSKFERPEGEETVTTGSFLVCKYGGLIEPINSGQNYDNPDEKACEEESEDAFLHGHFPQWEDNMEINMEEENELIRAVQFFLDKLGYLDSDNDYTNKFGGATKAALQLYQLNYGLEIDGTKIDKDLYEHLKITYLQEQGKIPEENLKSPYAANQIPGIPMVYKDGKYYYDYTEIINKLLLSGRQECLDHRIQLSYNEYIRKFYISSLMQQSPFFQYFGTFVMPPGLWLVEQVNTGKRWDLKNENSWNNAIPEIPYRSQRFKFIYNSKIIDSESLGNITYGYWGTACGFSDEVLYFGGGVVNDPLKVLSEYYGESEEDHEMVKYGIELYRQKYPNEKPKF